MDHTSDPRAVRYDLDPSRIDLAREFRANIRGPYSPDLQKLLVRMRWGPVAGRYALLVVEPGARWKLVRLPDARGQKAEVFDDVEFTSLDDAEWHVFRLRWQALGGPPLQLD